jgi:hypothetical protein
MASAFSEDPEIEAAWISSTSFWPLLSSRRRSVAQAPSTTNATSPARIPSESCPVELSHQDDDPEGCERTGSTTVDGAVTLTMTAEEALNPKESLTQTLGA